MPRLTWLWKIKDVSAIVLQQHGAHASIVHRDSSVGRLRWDDCISQIGTPKDWSHSLMGLTPIVHDQEDGIATAEGCMHL